MGKNRNSFTKILDFNKKKYEKKDSEPYGTKSEIISKRISFSPTKNEGSNYLYSLFKFGIKYL